MDLTKTATITPQTVAQYLDHPSGFVALSPRNQKFTLANLPGFIAYRQHGRHWIAFGGVHAPPDLQGQLLDAFLAAAQQQHCRVLVVQLRQPQVPLFVARGATINQFGTNFCLTLAGYNFAGTQKMQLRNKIKRARQAGLRVEELGLEVPRDPAIFQELSNISQRWLTAKGKPELDFMIGEIGSPNDTLRRIFLVRDATEQPVGFITYVPVWGERPGYLHDLTRRLPTAPVGAMELCNAYALERMMSEGVAYLHFGFTPFIVNGEELPQASKVMAWLVRMLYRHGSIIYPAQSQAHYKLKWGTDILEQEYIAGFPLSLRAAFDLLRVTRSF
jgi:lysylphosphatidylglycerol synthetase-like protein (DUF2156 family)